MSNLRVGDIVEIPQFGRGIVWFSNESRAAVVPEETPGLQYREKDGKIQFRATGESINVSPNSEVPVVVSHGRAGLVKYLQGREQQKTERKKTMKEQKTTKEKNGSRGKLGELFGFSICAVIRLMGSLGWNTARATAALEAAKIKTSEFTVKRQLFLGGKGEGEVAQVSKKQLEELAPAGGDYGPKAKAKAPAKAAKAAKKAPAEKAPAKAAKAPAKAKAAKAKAPAKAKPPGDEEPDLGVESED